MLCLEIAHPGGPEVLRLTERPDPVAAPGEVLIAVEAAGVNWPDVLQRQGAYPPPPGVTDVPGLEVAGRVARVGVGVREWREGDAVCALVAGGGYATHCVAPAVQCLPLPAGAGMVEAAALPEACCTVWTNLVERGALAAGESVLVHGGAGGIGTTAIQLAAARGATVAATAGSDERCRACERLGAAIAINYRTRDFADVVLEWSGGRGVDVVLDIVGGSYVPRNLRVLARDGRLVVIGLMGGESMAAIDLRLVLGRRLTMTGSTLRPRSVAEKAAIVAAVGREVWPLVARGRVRPIVARTVPLGDGAEAHRRLEAGEVVGKVVLVMPRAA
jgi:NADPH:quinone reductase